MVDTIDVKAEPTHKYQQIIDDLERAIHEGKYTAGSRIPSENQLSDQYGVSVPTVRKALEALVYQKKIYRIRGNGTFVSSPEMMEENIPDTPARKRQSKQICFIMVVDRNDSSIMKMIRGAQNYLFHKGYTMTMLCGAERSQSELSLIQECIENNVGGVLLFSTNPEDSLEGIRHLYQKGIKAVMLDRAPKELPTSLVAAYNVDGGYQMAKYFLENNHRKILFAADRLELVAEQDRLAGWRMALTEEGVDSNTLPVIEHTSSNLEDLVRLVKQQNITAIQCVNDKVAATVIRRLEQEGLHVPADVSVAGFDNSDESEYNYPRITTMDQPFEEMGRIAASKLLGLMAGSNHTQVHVPVSLIVKESTAPYVEKGSSESD